jgi:D-proline reductase (dithiol) PrdB
MAGDLNVVYPIERLTDMEREGVIGALASRHMSFMGAIGLESLSTIIFDTGRGAPRILREDGVDVVPLTPV